MGVTISGMTGAGSIRHNNRKPQLLSGECRPEPDGAEHCFLQRGSEAGLSYGL